jgi:hypothetical protein
VGLPQGGLLLLHLPVVVQQARLPGAGPAVAGVEHPRLVLMPHQHGSLLGSSPRASGSDRAVGGLAVSPEHP